MNITESAKGTVRREESLRRIIEHISSELDLRRLLTQIVENACGLLGADTGSIGLANPEETQIKIEAVHKMPVVEMGSEWGLGEGLAGKVLESRVPVVLNRYGEVGSGMIPESKDDSVIGVPIFWRSRITGFFGLGSKKGKTFTAEDVVHLEHLARHAAIAIENARLFAENQRSVAQASQLLDTTERIGNAMSVDEVVNAYLEQVAATGRYTCTIVLYEYDEDGNKMGNVVRGRWTPGAEVALMAYRVPTKKDLLDPILADGKTVRISNALEDPGVPKSLREEQTRDGRPAVALVPLMADRKRIGLVILSDPTPHEWTDEELLPFQATAAQLASVLASRRDHDALFESSRKLAVMEERRKIARDLHDSVTQVLFSLNLLAQTLEPGKAPPTEIMEKINQLSRRGLQDMRSLLEELRPVASASKSLNLGQKIASYAGSLVGLPELVIEYGHYRGAPNHVESELLGIASEALNNAAKHSKANQVKIVLQSTKSGVKLLVEDDGIGMRRESRSKQRVGLGLTTMRERAAEIGAALEFDSVPGKGTTIHVVWEAS